MPSINMIAPRRAEKKRLESNVRRLLAVILVEAVITAGVAGLFVSRIYGTRSMVQDLEVQLAKLQPTVHKIEQYEKATQELKPKMETLNQARSETLRWCRILDDLGTSLPPKVWLTRMSTAPVQASSDEITLNLNGVSPNQHLVGEAMLRIHDAVDDFNKLDLHYTQKAVVGFNTAVEFEIAAAMAVSKPDSKEVEKS